MRISPSGLLLAIATLWVIIVGSARTVHLPGGAISRPTDPYQIGYGMHVAVAEHMHLVEDAGFTYVKAYLSWANSEPEKGRYQWHYSLSGGDAHNIATHAQRSGLKLIVRVDTPPDWAAAGTGNRPPDNLSDFADFMAALARYLRGWVLAYEIYNEPNLSGEWGGQPPDPERYAAMLREVYPAIKSADPDALVISAGMATTAGDGGVTSMDDLEFIRRMYRAGAKGYFDVLGSHPYAFGSSPAMESDDGIADFLRPEEQRAVMLEFGDDSPIWATEFGWPIDPAELGREEYLAHPAWAGWRWQVRVPGPPGRVSRGRLRLRSQKLALDGRDGALQPGFQRRTLVHRTRAYALLLYCEPRPIRPAGLRLTPRHGEAVPPFHTITTVLTYRRRQRRPLYRRR